MELNETHAHAPIGVVLDREFSWEAPFSHPSTLEVGKVCAGPELFTTQAPLGIVKHLGASRGTPTAAVCATLARVSLAKSHSITWGNSGAEPAPLLTATHEAHASERLDYKDLFARG